MSLRFEDEEEIVFQPADPENPFSRIVLKYGKKVLSFNHRQRGYAGLLHFDSEEQAREVVKQFLGSYRESPQTVRYENA